MTEIDLKKALLTGDEVATFLNVRLNTVRRWSNQGLLKCYYIGPRDDRRFTKQDVLSFLRKGRNSK